jgi:hypothetical protein
MANSQILKSNVENYVRRKLKTEFGMSFEKKVLRVGSKKDNSAAMHEFDAVSPDGSIVVAIKTTTWGKNPGAKPNALYVDLYFLSRIKAKKKFLILTNRDTYKGFLKISDGKRPKYVKIRFKKLPSSLQRRVNKNMKIARNEMKLIGSVK